MSLSAIREEAKKITGYLESSTTYWFPDKEEVRLVELDPSVSPSNDTEIHPFYFRPSPEDGLFAPSAIALIHLDDFGKLNLPPSWGKMGRRRKTGLCEMIGVITYKYKEFIQSIPKQERSQYRCIALLEALDGVEWDHFVWGPRWESLPGIHEILNRVESILMVRAIKAGYEGDVEWLDRALDDSTDTDVYIKFNLRRLNAVIMAVVIAGHLDALRLLLQKGAVCDAPIMIKGTLYASPLTWAIETGDARMSTLLRLYGVQK